MTPFLQQVARHYLHDEGDISRSVFVFPNRRSLSFFKKYLGQEAGGRVFIAPQTLSIGDFFFKVCGLRATDRVQLLLTLYESYSKVRRRHGQSVEPLDEFIFWGDMILGDFSDIDKYLVNPRQIFANIAEFKKLQSYDEGLTETQLKAIERFFEHFTLRRDGRMKQEFQQIWDILYELYQDYNALLAERHEAYDGKVYRDFAERLTEESAVDVLSKAFPKCDRFIFVGLNALSECEKKVLGKMRNARIAEFCWDYSSSMIRSKDNRSSLFLDENIEKFPQAFKFDEDGLPQTKFHVLGVPSSVGQAKQLPQILDMVGARGIETAVVLPDETLLMPVLNSIPEQLKNINVTMGFPLSGSQLWALMDAVAALQLHVRDRDGETWFYHRQVRAIFANPIFRRILSEEERAIVEAIEKEGRYYIARHSFGEGEVLSSIFRKTATIPETQAYQLEVIRTIAAHLDAESDMMLELDFAKDYYLCVEHLQSFRELDNVSQQTYYRLLQSLVGSTAVPFHGEPLAGLQVMGPLETRALDFDNLIILSCNEGMFPRRSVGESFVPAELRKGFGLPTSDYQDSVWAYYFYRMIQRASNVWMLYDTRTEMSRSGEESRYIKQLEMHFGVQTERLRFSASLSSSENEDCIEKTEDHLKKIHERNLSATALQTYLSCPAKFYFQMVEGLKEPDEIEDSLDAAGIGSAFHMVMRKLYDLPDKTITRDYLKTCIQDKSRIRAMVDAEVMFQLKTFEVTGRNIIFADIIESYVKEVLRRDLQKLETMGKESFHICALEQKLPFKIGSFTFTGTIDRLDSFEPGVLRVVDYKTGKVLDEDLNINAANAAEVVGHLFGKDDANRPKIALQLYLYDILTQRKFAKGDKIVNSIYQTSRMFTEGIGESPLCEEFQTLMDEAVAGLLAEIEDLDIPFTRRPPRPSDKVCEWCEFKNICGR